jgi:ribosome-associated heat shock protein Hsp15
MTGVRMDIWLWAARFFKTRALAKRACELGRVQSMGHEAKPAREVRAGDRLQVTTESGDFEIDVLQLSEIRGPAAVAQALYKETEPGRAARIKAAELRKANAEFAPSPERRPTKKERRKIVQFRGRG